MANVRVENNRYTVDSLYQWDLNQVLEIYGLSLPFVPEIHFTNDAMDRAIVRPASMNAAGVITVDVPNSVLQKAGKLKVYICNYESETFQTLYKLEIVVKARVKPSDYTLIDDPEVYSFNALENMVYNAVTELHSSYNAFTAKSTADFQAAKDNLTVIAEGAAASAEAANNAAASAAASAAAESIELAILKGDVSEIVKVNALPDDPADDVLYLIV